MHMLRDFGTGFIQGLKEAPTIFFAPVILAARAIGHRHRRARSGGAR